ncbi:MAG: hypothetical protein ACRENP_01045 [Longimicrobiales bacterium]
MLVLTAFAIPHALHAQRDTLPALPDSAYLMLTLELAIEGTFYVNQIRLFSANERRVTVMHELRDVEVEGCLFRWRHRTRIFEDRAALGRMRETRVPLKALDLDRMIVRPALPGSGSRFDPQPYEIVGYASQRRTRPIVSVDMDSGLQNRDWTFAIPVREEEAARRLSAALIEAGRRCDTWRTAPLPVIR